MQYLKAVPSKIQTFQTKKVGVDFVNVYGPSGWHLVTIEQIKKFKMAVKMAAHISKSNYHANIHVLAYSAPEISAVNTM